MGSKKNKFKYIHKLTLIRWDNTRFVEKCDKYEIDENANVITIYLTRMMKGVKVYLPGKRYRLSEFKSIKDTYNPKDL